MELFIKAFPAADLGSAACLDDHCNQKTHRHWGEITRFLKTVWFLHVRSVLVLACLHTGRNTGRWRNLPPNKRCLSLWRLMAQRSFYSILQVEPIASLDEIKLAFKKRALQVHPDKGGSKEAFHLVYEALETLADPLARKKYDHALASGKAGNIGPERQEPHTGKKKTKKAARKPGPSTAKKAHSCGRTESTPQDPQASQSKMSKQTKLLIRIRDLLKKLPRELRNDVFTKQFSQQQRLILEKWMVDTSYEDSEAPKVPVDKTSMQQMQLMQHGDDQNHHTFATTPEPTNEPTSVGCRGNLPIASSTFKKVPNTRARKLQRIRDKKKDAKIKSIRDLVAPMNSLGLLNPEPKSSCHKKVRSNTGNIRKGHSGSKAGYSARICFDALELSTRYGDLQTALEFLVILTSVKQRMHNSMTASTSFEDRLEEALSSSAREQGRTVKDLDMRFAVHQSPGFLIGRGFQLHSPVVRSVQVFGRLRRRLEPFRKYAKKIGWQNIYWWYSPTHLQDAWEQFQTAVADVWEMAGADSAAYLQKMRGYHQATAYHRGRFLQLWERQHMAIQDKNKHKPNRLRERSTTRNLEFWERRQMAIEDKLKHCPKSLRKRNIQNLCQRKLQMLKKLLARWTHMLKGEAQLQDKERRRVLQQRKVQQKKDQENRRRSAALNRKRLREEEHLRKEATRKRNKSGFFMDDLLWVWPFLASKVEVNRLSAAAENVCRCHGICRRCPTSVQSLCPFPRYVRPEAHLKQQPCSCRSSQEKKGGTICFAHLCGLAARPFPSFRSLPPPLWMQSHSGAHQVSDDQQKPSRSGDPKLFLNWDNWAIIRCNRKKIEQILKYLECFWMAMECPKICY